MPKTDDDIGVAMDPTKPPDPLPPEHWGPITDQAVRIHAEALDMSLEEARAHLELMGREIADEFNRDRLREWREAYGPDPDDDQDDDDQDDDEPWDPLSEQERDAPLDACALIEAEARGDQLARSVLLFASDDPAYLRRIIGTLAYMVVEAAGDPEVLAAIRRKFAGAPTSP